MMHFDVIVPFGTSCMCSDILREQGLQMYSYPFDWVGGGTLETRTNILVNDFKDWLNYDDLVQIEPLDNLKTRKFKDFLNVKTCMTFRHHFSVDKNSPNFIEDYSTVKEKYTRRAERLKHQIQQSDNVLMITIETPNRYKIKHVQELLLAHNMLAKKFSMTNIQLLYIKHSDNKNMKCSNVYNNIQMIDRFYTNDPSSNYDIALLVHNIFQAYDIRLSQKFCR